MSYIERGLYRELLDEAWIECFIPDDLAKLADICGCPLDVIEAAWPNIRRRFEEIEPGLMVNRKLEAQRTDTDAVRAKRALSGALGGKTRLANAKQMLASASKCHIEEKRRVQKRKEDKELAVSRLPAVASPSLIELPQNDGTSFLVTAEQVAHWASLYPAVDVLQELRKMLGWAETHPRRSKTASGMPKFINAWLSKAQDRGGDGRNQGNSPAVQRQHDSDGAIDRAAKALFGFAAPDEADESELRGSGDHGGDGALVDARLAKAFPDARTGKPQSGAEVIEAQRRVLSFTGKDRGGA